MNKKFYITTPVYYVNDNPHIGHAYTTVAADVLTRSHRMQGKEAYFLTGTDEHGLKIQRKAEEAGKETQQFVDKIAENFKDLWNKLEIKYDNFIRTTDPNHKEAVQKVLQNLFEKGAIYKGEYEGLYCVGCEQFKQENELVDSRCPEHDTVCEVMKEESYLLKMEDKQKELVEKIEKDEFKIRPEKYKGEILSFLKNEKLKDISISRRNVSWGIPLPFDEEHTTYVWFDAFLSYLTGLGWDGSSHPSPRPRVGELPSGPLRQSASEASRGAGLVEKFWPADVQLIGKDILRVHATIWPIMLMHLGIKLPKMLFIHGHLLSGGRKMSKTIGNVIPIDEMLEKFGVDGTRYLLMSAGTFGEDVDVTMERLTEKYNADLANGIGNLASRILRLAQNFQFSIAERFGNQSGGASLNFQTVSNLKVLKYINNIEIDKSLEEIWKIIRENDKYIETNKPWELVKNSPDKFEEVMEKLISDLYLIAEMLIPFMPETAEKIRKSFDNKKTEILFPRLK